MRVFAIAQGLCERPGKGAAAGRFLADRLRHPAGHRGIIGGGAGIGDLRQPLPEGEGGLAVVGIEFRQNGGVILDIDHGGDKGMVLRRRADHRRATDVDILDAVVIGGALGHGGLERVKVDHQQVDHLDAMGFHRGQVLGIVAQRQKPAMHLGMQGLHAAVHHLGEAGHFGHVAHA